MNATRIKEGLIITGLVLLAAIGAACHISVDIQRENKIVELESKIIELEENPIIVVELIQSSDEQIIDTPPIKEPGRYDSLMVTEHEKELLARCAYYEARGDGETGMRAVVEVVLNRCLNNKFPSTVSDVLYQKNQFSTASMIRSGSIQEPQSYELAVQSVEHVLSQTDYLLEEDVGYFRSFPYKTCTYTQILNHYFARM